MLIKALGNTYPFPTRRLTLGDQQTIKRAYGVKTSDIFDELDDPDNASALLYWAMREQDPNSPDKMLIEAIKRARSIDIVGDDGEPLVDQDDDDGALEREENPTPPATPAEDSGSEPSSSKAGE